MAHHWNCPYCKGLIDKAVYKKNHGIKRNEAKPVKCPYCKCVFRVR